MAEFFSECVKQIELRLGPSDSEIQEKLKYLSDGTKKSVIEDSFSIHGNFVILEGLNTSVTEYIQLIKQYFECSSISDITLFESRVAVTDADIEYITSFATKLKTIEIPAVPGTGITDKTAKILSEKCSKMQVIRFRGNCQDLTDNTFQYIAKMPEITRITCWSASQLTDQALFYVSQLNNLQEVKLTGDALITDIGIGYLQNLQFLGSESKNYSEKGIEQVAKRNANLQILELKWAKLEDKAIGHILTWNKHIHTIDFSSSTPSGKCLFTAPVPASLAKLVVKKGTTIAIPSRSICKVFWANS